MSETVGYVKPGQEWISNDPRDNGRSVFVERTDSRYAYCRSKDKETGRPVRIQLDSFKLNKFLKRGFRPVFKIEGLENES